SDGARWLLAELARCGVGAGLVLIAGDEFGQLGGLPGSDSLLLVPEAARATAVSVGAEPTGTPADVLALGGGPDRFLELLADQLARRRRGELPELDPDPAWTLTVDGVDPLFERVHESLLTLVDGRLGTRGTPLGGDAAADPGCYLAGAYTGTGPETALVRCPEWSALSRPRPAAAAPPGRPRELAAVLLAGAPGNGRVARAEDTLARAASRVAGLDRARRLRRAGGYAPRRRTRTVGRLSVNRGRGAQRARLGRGGRLRAAPGRAPRGLGGTLGRRRRRDRGRAGAAATGAPGALPPDRVGGRRG